MDDIQRCKSRFTELIHHARALGVISPGVVEILQRAQTRKEWAWCGNRETGRRVVRLG